MHVQSEDVPCCNIQSMTEKNSKLEIYSLNDEVGVAKH